MRVSAQAALMIFSAAYSVDFATKTPLIYFRYIYKLLFTEVDTMIQYFLMRSIPRWS